MLEFIRLIVETLGKSLLPSLELKRNKQRLEIGAELFTLYAQVSEAMLCADDILDNLERFVQRAAELRRMGGTPSRGLFHTDQLANILLHQRRCLARIAESMGELSITLNVVEPDAVSQLAPLLRGKTVALNALLREMERGRIPVAEPAIEQLVSEEGGQHFFRAEVRSTAIAIHADWSQELLDAVTNYLDTKRPRERVAEIRASLAKLRTALEEHYSLSEILTIIGAQRGRRPTSWTT